MQVIFYQPLLCI